MPFIVGQTVGDYVVVRPADADGFPGVYAVEHTITRRREAMRILGRDGQCPVEDVARFFDEIKHRARLSHPNIAAVHNAFWADDSLVTISEWVDGESLRSALKKGPLPLARSLEIMSGVLQAVAYAHANGVRNCSVSPETIFLADDGTAKLLNITTGNTQDDLVACGVMFQELIAGSANPTTQLAAELNATVARATADEPESRFPSAAAFLDVVRQLRQRLDPAPIHRPRAIHARIMTGVAVAGLACILILMASALNPPIPPPVAQLATPAPPPVNPAVAVPAPGPKPVRKATPPPLPAEPAVQKKNPITRLGGAIKRLNPIRRQNTETQ